MTITTTKGAQSARDFLGQPRAMYLLFFVQMWESFSFYGMRALLVLYMINGLNFSDIQAFGVYAMYTTLSECLGIFGGRISDKILGLRYSIYTGGVMIAIGHIILTFSLNEYAIYLSLAFIAAGTGLFRTNCTTLLGEFYKKNDPRRSAGYTLFYVGLNLGGFMAALGCAFVAESYGWHAGFLLAAIGMFLGLLTLFKFRNMLESRGKKPEGVRLRSVILTIKGLLAIAPCFAILIYFYEVSQYAVLCAIVLMFTFVLYRTVLTNGMERINSLTIMAAVLLLALFYGFEEQVSSTVIVFADRFASKDFFGINMPASSLVVFNPLTILVLGPLLAIVMRKLEAGTKRSFGIFAKISLAFLIQGLAFSLLYTTALDGYTSSYMIALVMGIIAFSELFIGPAVYALCAELAPKQMKATMMGLVMLGYSLSNSISGFLSQYMAVVDGDHSVYENGFLKVTITCVAVAIMLYSVNVLIKKMRVQ